MDFTAILSYNYTFAFVVLLMGLLLLTGRKIRLEYRRNFLTLLGFTIAECVSHNVVMCMEHPGTNQLVLSLFAVATYTLRAVVFYLVLLLALRDWPKKLKYVLAIPIGVVAICSLSVLWTEAVFNYTSRGTLVLGPYYPLTFSALVIYLTLIIGCAVFQIGNHERRRESQMLLLSAGFVFFGLIGNHLIKGLSVSMESSAALSIFAYYCFFRSMDHLQDYDDLELDFMRKRMSLLELDDMTKLYTPNAFFQYAQALVDQHPDKTYGIMAMDVANFKFANMQYGTEKCDEFLVYVADCIKKMFPLGVYGRIAGDKFVAIYDCDEVTEENGFIHMAENMMRSAPIAGQTLKFGIYKAVDRSLNMVRCTDNAFVALKSIKDMYGDNYAYYNEQMSEQVSFQQRIVDSMEAALNQDQLQVYYQPKHDTYTGKLVGAEALVRWIHPQMGFMPPDYFIPIFEKNGFITKLDSYVVRQVILDLARWVREGKNVVPISVNVSRKDFFEKDWIARHMLLADYSGVDTRFIHFEVTESLYMEEDGIIKNQINMLRDKGYKIEMDDFGSGYSSLGTMATFPLDIVKLDISFIRNISSTKIMVETIIDMVHRMGYKVISEGVETEREVQILQQLGCDYIQGYFFSKPLPKVNFELYMEQTHGDSYLFQSGVKNQDHWSKFTEDSEIKRALLDCMSVISREGNEVQSIQKLLEIIGNFYGADRTYLIEMQTNTEFRSFHGEWCKDGVESHEHAFRMGGKIATEGSDVFFESMPETSSDDEMVEDAILDLDKIYENKSWMSQYDSNGSFYLKSTESVKTSNPMMYLTLKNLKVDSFMSTLIQKDGKVMALVGVDNPTVHTDSMELIPAISQLLMSEIARDRDLVRAYLLDDLTGVYSVKYLDFWRENKQPAFPFTVLVGDCNFLKKFNDQYGHECGDQLLALTGEVLRECLPDHCKIIRTGGDEFLALCDAVDETLGDEMIQEVLKRAKTKKIQGQELSIAIGKCTVDEAHYDFDVVRAIADKEMYAMKKAMKANVR